MNDFWPKTILVAHPWRMDLHAETQFGHVTTKDDGEWMFTPDG